MEVDESEQITGNDDLEQQQDESQGETTTGTNILIVYFTRLDNTKADLDTIVQGGGPYGEIGNSYAEANMDAISSASITVRNDEVLGNTQAVAEMIQQLTGGDMFSIRTIDSYPVDYDELIDLGGTEKNTGARPELVENMEQITDYDIVFLGFPNWWMDMPMALYSFLEECDLSGKRIIPFATSASSGLSNAVVSIKELQPEAEVEENGLHIPMREVNEAEERIEDWLMEIGVIQNN